MEKKVLVFTLILLGLLLANALLWKLSSTEIIAGAAVIAIGVSWHATYIVRKAAQGELVIQIGKIYGSPEMLEAMMRLIWWVEKEEKKSKEENWLETFRELRKDCDRYCEIEQVDKDRRMFLDHYEAFEILEKYGLLSKKIVKDLRSENQELFYKRVVRPLTDKIETKVTKEWPRLTVDYSKKK